MDVNDIRTLLLVAAVVAFVGIVVWAYSSRRKRDFDEAARLPFDDGDPAEVNGSPASTSSPTAASKKDGR